MSKAEPLETGSKMTSIPRFDSSILTVSERKEYEKLLKTYKNYQTQYDLEIKKLTDPLSGNTISKQLQEKIRVKRDRLQRTERDIRDVELSIVKVQEELAAKLRNIQRDLEALNDRKADLEAAIEKESKQVEELRSHPRSGNTIVYEHQMEAIAQKIKQLVGRYVEETPAPPVTKPPPVQHEESDSESECSVPEETPVICVPAVEPEKKEETVEQMPPPIEAKPLIQSASNYAGERGAYYKWCVDEEGCVAGPEDLEVFIERKKRKGVPIPEKYLQTKPQQTAHLYYTPQPIEAPPAPRIIGNTKKVVKQAVSLRS